MTEPTYPRNDCLTCGAPMLGVHYHEPETADPDTFAAMTDDELLEAMSLPMHWSTLAEYQAELERRGLDPFGEG